MTTYLSPSRRRRGDAGFTLPELLIVLVLSGTLVAVISMAISVMLRATPQAEARLAESKDITFLQTWIPVDLATAINSYSSPNDAVVKAALVANPPHISYNATLEGTNVLTLVVPNAKTNKLEIIVYRYVKVGDEYQLVRYRISNPGTPSESVSVVGVAHEILPPPVGWVQGDPVPFAFEVLARNQAAVRPVGEDVTVHFSSGNEFRTGGAGLSAQRDLTPNDPDTLPDPTAPPSRCGGRVALVIDTSGSVPLGQGGVPTQQAAVGFINAFVGTPTQVSLNGFDNGAYGMIDNPAHTPRYVALHERAPFVSVLDKNASVTALTDRVMRLDNFDGPSPKPTWPGGGAPLAQRDPNGDGVHWDQVGANTNWEDGLFNVFFDSSGQPYNSYQPDLVVFITDGQPNLVRNSDGSSASANQDTAAARARLVANAGRSQGARVIGIMVGNSANNETYVNLLKSVVASSVNGAVPWNGHVNSDGTIDVGNAVSADFFTGSFSQLGGVLRSIMVAECGGTVTVRKAMESGAPAQGQWTYSTETGGQVLDTNVRNVLDADRANSVTFDFAFENDQNAKTVTIREETRDHTTFVRADCSVGGVLITDPAKIQPLPDNAPGVSINLRPDEAVSCVMVSRAS